MQRTTWVFLLFLLGACQCASGFGDRDAAVDATTDGGVDGGDAMVDATVDATDAGPDADSGTPRTPRRLHFVTSGGGRSTSTMFQAELSVGAPPAATLSGPSRSLTLGPKAARP